MNDIRNALSVDVEEYFQVLAFEKHISRASWDEYQTRVEENLERILAILNEYNTAATFFVLGWIAERHPIIIRKISEAGHEIASHGYSHIRVNQQTPLDFRNDVIKTKIILEDISGIPVVGYRAASYSINSTHHWAHDVLGETGHKYSSSVYPIKHDIYGVPDAPRFPYKVNSGELLEIPVTTVEFMKHRIPCGGGGYFRLFPYLFSKFMIDRVNKSENKPCVFYFHPWEIDTKQPRKKGLNMKTRVRHYLNLGRMESRIRNLLSDFKWDRIDKIYLNR